MECGPPAHARPGMPHQGKAPPVRWCPRQKIVWSAAMDLLFITPGLAPFDDATGSPEVSAALPKALKALGHRITLVAPLPENFDLSSAGFSRRLSPLEVELKGEPLESVYVYDGRSMGGTQLVFLDHASFADLFVEGAAGLRAQLIFATAVDALVEKETTFDLAHVHDEAAALACVLLARAKRLPTVYTVYDTVALDFTAKSARALGFKVTGSRFSPVAEAVKAADFVTTTSPGRAARAVLQSDSLVGAALESRRAQFAGIANGVDTSVYNPLTDPLLVARYTPHEPLAKMRNKTMLQRELGLDMDPDVPLLGVVEGEVGAARLIEPLRELLRNDVQVAMQVLDEDAECADGLIELSKLYPERFQVRLGDSKRRTHAILSGVDALVVTGDEPTLAMAAHRYGALPVVASDTSAAEHCIDVDAKLQSGNAVIYDPQVPGALRDAMRRAAAAFNRGAPFDRLRVRLMRIDHSFERAARAYDAVYATVLGLGPAATEQPLAAAPN